MKRFVFLAFLLLTSISCYNNSEKGKSGQDSISQEHHKEIDPNAPDWYNNPPTSDSLFYGIGTGASTNMSIAERKAILQANVDIAEKIYPTQSENSTLEADLVNVTIVKRECKLIDSKYVVYVMIKMHK